MGILVNIKEFLSSIPSLVKTFDKIKLKQFLKYLFIISLSLFVCWIFLFLSNKVFMENLANCLKQNLEEKRIEGIKSLDQRTEISPIIRQNHKDLLNSIHADRVLLQEFHNGVVGGGGVGFKFINESYEITNEIEGVNYVALKYQNLNVSLLPICEEVVNKGFFMGDIEDVKSIDPAFAQIMEEQGMYYVALYFVVSEGKKIGILNAYWKKENNPNFAENFQKISCQMELVAHKKNGDADLLIYKP